MESSGNPNLLRALNTKAVLAALKGEGRATKQRLAVLTGLSTVTVNAALDQLAGSGEALLDQVVPSNGGRPAQSYRFHARHRCGLALYLWEERLYIRVADLNGVCIFREDEPLGQVDGVRFRPTVERMLRAFPNLGRIGFGLPGVIREGRVVHSDHPGLTGVRLAEDYEGWYGLPVGVENDVNLAVLGYGGAEAADSVAYLYFPNREPPGAGILVNGALCRGRHNLAGEIGGLLPGVDWRTLDRGDFDAVCAGVAGAVHAYACILDPARIVLYGAFLTEAHRVEVGRLCAESMDIGFLPALERSGDLGGDYERGAILLALGNH